MLPSRAAADIAEFAPRRPFLDNFRRWEWMLVGLLLVVIVLNSRLSPYFLKCHKSLTSLV